MQGEKYKRGDFGRCPRVLCNGQPVLPVGLSDIAKVKTVKVYCPKCEDVYHPKSSRHVDFSPSHLHTIRPPPPISIPLTFPPLSSLFQANLDGAHFGTSLPHILFQVFPNLLPQKTHEKFVPRMFGFKIHSTSLLYQRKPGNGEEHPAPPPEEVKLLDDQGME